MLTAQDVAFFDDELTAAELHVVHCMDSWLADDANSPAELLEAMADFIQRVVIQTHTTH